MSRFVLEVGDKILLRRTPRRSEFRAKSDTLTAMVRAVASTLATAAALTIAEVEELVEPGELDPDHIVTPGIYVKRVVVGEMYRKPVESRFIKEQIAGGVA